MRDPSDIQTFLMLIFLCSQISKSKYFLQENVQKKHKPVINGFEEEKTLGKKTCENTKNATVA